MRFHGVYSAIATLTILVLARPVAAASINDFLNYSFLDNNNQPLLRGLLHVPAEYATDPTTPRPLILFLHGAGESGTNNFSQINGNIDNLLTAAKSRGAFLYAPQTNIGWEDPTLLSYAMTMIDRAIDDRSVDLNRIYVTGLSMGGGGVWNFVNQFPDRVAAAVPICAVSPSSSFVPAKVVNEPVWAFHGRSDSTVSVTVTRNIINSLLTEGGQPVPTYPAISNMFGPDVPFDFPPLDLHYTDKKGDHGIWPAVYATPAIYDWMFAHGSVPEPSTLVLLCVGAISLLGYRKVK